MTKKQKKIENNKHRNTWTMSPVTRIKQSKKIYNRQRDKKIPNNDN